ncbi:hypothetical protein M3Y98_00583300 [Aphelenchoides besseyi]|nr:hypothetical protein M3Y98_00583300 [Aphelenchoides besseyi]
MSKPQLTTYSKAILLMHRNEYVCNRPPDNELSALEFFKYLLISRQFLQASQLHQVYEFAIFEYSSDDKKFYVSSMKGKFDEVWATGFKLTLEEIRTWNQLLDVQYVRLYRYHYKYADEFSAVSKLFRATIDDNFFDDFPTCPSVKKLKFTWRNLDEMHNIVPKVTKMMPFFPNLCQLYCYTSKYHAPGEFSLQKLVVWIRDECRKIEELQKASLSLTDVVVKQLVKEILNTTEFKVLRFAKLVMPGTEEHKYNGFIRPYCKVELWREQPNGVAALQFKVDLDPLTLDDDDESEDELSEDESAEHRDN